MCYAIYLRMFVKGRFPHVFNLATNAEITTNATCGEEGPESFCKLVEHVKRRPGDRIQCGVCDDSSTRERHPIDFAIDGSNRWWQSPTIANGRQFNWVTITLDLKQVRSVLSSLLHARRCPTAFGFSSLGPWPWRLKSGLTRWWDRLERSLP